MTQQQQLFATHQVQMQQWMALQQQHMMVEHMQASMLAVQNGQPMPAMPAMPPMPMVVILPTPGVAPETPVVSYLTSLFFYFNNYRLRIRRDLDSLRNLEKVETY
jgi:hypothetical protein